MYLNFNAIHDPKDPKKSFFEFLRSYSRNRRLLEVLDGFLGMEGFKKVFQAQKAHRKSHWGKNMSKRFSKSTMHVDGFLWKTSTTLSKCGKNVLCILGFKAIHGTKDPEQRNSKFLRSYFRNMRLLEILESLLSMEGLKKVFQTQKVHKRFPGKNMSKMSSNSTIHVDGLLPLESFCKVFFIQNSSNICSVHRMSRRSLKDFL